MHRPGYVQSAACWVYAVPMVYQLQLTYAVGVLHKSFLMKDMGNYTRYFAKGRINVKKKSLMMWNLPVWNRCVGIVMDLQTDK